MEGRIYSLESGIKEVVKGGTQALHVSDPLEILGHGGSQTAVLVWLGEHQYSCT